MWRLRLTTQAKQDIREIARYLTSQSGSATVGRRFALRLKRTCEKLASLDPVLGRPRPELGEGLRSFPTGNYLVLIKYARDTLEIVAIVERHRDMSALLETRQDTDEES